METNKKIRAFTVLELLVTMTLTGILVAFAFTGYNQMQKLFLNYSVQSEFISEYNQLNKALFVVADRSEIVEEVSDKIIKFKIDSSYVDFEMTDKAILLKFKYHTDTFHLPVKEKKVEFLNSENAHYTKVVKSFSADVFFQSQKFRVSFQKQYDAESVLKSTLELLPPDELY